MFPYFEEILGSVNRNLLRVVEYCYYNCCECEDYYELQNDDTELILKAINQIE